MYIHLRYRLNDRDENQIIYSLYTEKLNILEHPVSLIYELFTDEAKCIILEIVKQVYMTATILANNLFNKVTKKSIIQIT